MESLKIIAPEGYEIDRARSTFEEVFFKLKVVLSEKEDVLGELGFFCDEAGNMVYESKQPISCATKEQAVALVAISLLTKLIRRYENQLKTACPLVHSFSITYKTDLEISKSSQSEVTFLRFPTKDTAKMFLDKYKDLIIDAAPILFGRIIEK